jgi:hypothetical protein
MINKLSTEVIVKGYIPDYTKIRDEYKTLLRLEGFIWMKCWERHNMVGMEGVWLNPVTRVTIRIRWGIVHPHAIVYVEKEFVDIIKQFFSKRFYVDGMSTPNEDYDILNKGF